MIYDMDWPTWFLALFVDWVHKKSFASSGFLRSRALFPSSPAGIKRACRIGWRGLLIKLNEITKIASGWNLIVINFAKLQLQILY